MAWMLRGLVPLQLALLFLGSLALHAESVVAPPPPPPPPSHPPPPPPYPFLSPPPQHLHPQPVKTIRIAVEGVIYCRSCRLPGYDKSLDASPLPGVVATVKCSSGTYTASATGTTDGRGYFYLQVPKVPTYVIRSCKVFVVSLPPSCNTPVFPTYVEAGVPLKFERFLKVGSTVHALYTAGFLEFRPANPTVCPHLP